MGARTRRGIADSAKRTQSWRVRVCVRIMVSLCRDRAPPTEHPAHLRVQVFVNTPPGGVHGSTPWMLTKVTAGSVPALRPRAGALLLRQGARGGCCAGRPAWPVPRCGHRAGASVHEGAFGVCWRRRKRRRSVGLGAWWVVRQVALTGGLVRPGRHRSPLCTGSQCGRLAEADLAGPGVEQAQVRGGCVDAEHERALA